MKNVVVLVLGGGRGTRLYPLTKFRAKPAVPVAGKYRLIDIPLSNCINSGLNRIYVLTQFLSVSLHRHIRSTYVFDPFSRGFVEILAAQQTSTRQDWYQGTADAVRHNLRYLREPGIDYVFILSGDQLYRMDFRTMLRTHTRSGADVTISATPVHSHQAHAFGIMRVDDTGQVVGFLEKPKSEEELSMVRTEPAWIDAHGIASQGRDCLASMGIYLFNRDTLIDALEKTDYQDFGREVFPASIRARHVQVHLFDGYWEDIGTIKSFFEANLALTHPGRAFDLNVQDAPIFSRARFLPPTRIDGATIRWSLVADGCAIGEGTTIENSIIGLRSIIGRNVTIRNAVLMGNDFFQIPGLPDGLGPYGIPLGIGDNSRVENTIIDKNCCIGRRCAVVPDPTRPDTPESDYGMVRDGILVIPKGVTLGEDWRL